MKYLSSMPMTFLIAPATEPLFVELAKLKDNIEYFSRQYLISVVAPQVIAVPIAVYMLGNHELVTNILLGEKWLPYSKLLTIFSFAAVFVILWQKAIQLLILDEHSKLFFRCELGSFVGVYLLLITLAPSDIELFAFFKVLIEATLGILLFAWVVTKKLGLKVTVRMLILLLPIVFASTLAFSTTYISINFGVIWDFIIHTILFFLLYFVCLISFAWLVKNKIAEWGYLWEVGLRAISQFRREKAPRGC